MLCTCGTTVTSRRGRLEFGSLKEYCEETALPPGVGQALRPPHPSSSQFLPVTTEEQIPMRITVLKSQVSYRCRLKPTYFFLTLQPCGHIPGASTPGP